MITKNYMHFFKELENNNNKEWFHANKKSYEKDVKLPFLNLLDTIIPYLKELEPKISENPKDALFRINRDIRFSKDKSPYNLLMKAGFSANGKKSELPGYYLGISASKIYVGGGLFNLRSDTLKKVRTHIAQDPKALVKIINSKQFSNYFNDLKGERSKRLDKAFQPILEITPYIANKQFYTMEDLPIVNHINSDKLHNVIIDRFKAIGTLNDYLMEAII